MDLFFREPNYSFSSYDLSIPNLNSILRIYGGRISFFHNGSNQTVYMDGLNFAYPDGFIDRGTGTGTSLSPISYEAIGNSPDMILKVEWKNAGLSKNTNDFANFQMWLYQKNGAIEIHYGPSSVTNASKTNTFIGLGHIYDPTSNEIENDYLIGSPSYTVLSKKSSDFFGIPANGTVYKFLKNTTSGINDLSNSDLPFSVYPNPSNGTFTISVESLKVGKLQVFNVLGEVVYQSAIVNPQSEISLKVPTGIYFLQLQTEKEIITRKLIIE